MVNLSFLMSKNNLMKAQWISLLLIMGVFYLIGCSKEEIDVFECDTGTPTYTNDIKAIMDGSCAFSGCHDASSSKRGYDLSDYTGTKEGSENDAFLGSIQHKNSYDNMPRNGSKLSDESIELISCWVQNGAPE